ncbi:DUF6868 family protein [Marinobacterium arenosum]|uniref:DUF6868 family protein n=1 Tax=Marinobacterium arenosum TaxID=2862496 RepID=UPI001C97D2EF|nr:hypothetical protein [Marinobacterium arenosum]MBY4675242.1 hypothetical protein [Marinobacterium arenosum]
MSTEQLSDLLLWGAVINYGLLLWWLLLIVTAHDWLYRLHRRWFRLTMEQFDLVHYSGIALYKLAILMLYLVPFIAIQLTR